MDYRLAFKYAEEHGSEQFGSSVVQKINSSVPSQAVGHLNYLRSSIHALFEFFEAQKLAFDKNNLNWFEEFHVYTKQALDGNIEDIKGVKHSLKSYFRIDDFIEDEKRKRAAALFLKYYLQYLKDNVNGMTVQDLLDLPLEKTYDWRYFDKDYVFGELISVAEDNAE